MDCIQSHSLHRSFIHSFIHAFVGCFTHSFLFHSSIHCFVHSLILLSIHSFIHLLFSLGHATLHLAMSVRPSQIFLNRERFLHYRPCPTVRDCPAVYPALFSIHGRWRARSLGCHHISMASKAPHKTCMRTQLAWGRPSYQSK